MPNFLTIMASNQRIAYEFVDGNLPCVIFLGGFNSNMRGAKAVALEAHCCQRGQAFVRFDYRAHGQSDGDFTDCNISTWLQDCTQILDWAHARYGTLCLVGSSMGGWLAMLTALQRPQFIHSLLLIACAADMTRSYPARLDGLLKQVDTYGREFYAVPNQYDDQVDYQIYQHLIDDGEQHCLLDAPIQLTCPVRLLHGDQDDVVELNRSRRVPACLTTSDAQLHVINGGDHRLSSPQDLHTLTNTLNELLAIKLQLS